MVETGRRPILSGAVMLTVFEVAVDQEGSQLLDSVVEVDADLFAKPVNGESVAARPWPALRVFDPEFPSANFFYFHPSFLVMDTNAANVLNSVLSSYGEFVRLNVTSVGDVLLFNPWLTLETEAVDWPRTKGKLGTYHQISFNKERIPHLSIFRIEKMGGIFLSTELEEDESDFFYLYQKHQLTGLTFKKLWDEQSGAVTA